MPAPQVWMLAVPETAGVHWKTRSGETPELPQLPVSRLVPLVVPVKVPPCAEMMIGLVQLPVVVVVAEVSPAPWQTARPSLLHSPSVCFLHARRRPPAATHAAISSTQARRHCLPGDVACEAGAKRSSPNNAGRDASPRILTIMPLPPRLSRVAG